MKIELINKDGRKKEFKNVDDAILYAKDYQKNNYSIVVTDGDRREVYDYRGEKQGLMLHITDPRKMAEVNHSTKELGD